MIRDLKSGQVLTARQLAERLATASHVLVGEQHNNPDHHALQLWLLQALADRRPQGSLLLEILTASQQAHVDAARAGIATSSYPADLCAALNWQPRWDWDVYGPVLRFALAQPYPLLAAGPDPDDNAAIPERLARSLSQAPPPAMLFAETDYARKDIGAPLYMTAVDPGDSVVVLLLAQKGDLVEPGSADYVWFTAALS